MPGVTIDGRDPLEVYDTVRTAVARARSGEGPTLVESQMYRLSAHGNIIAPPGVPLHFPEHEAIEKFGAPEEYEAAKRGDPVPALPRRGSSPTASSPPRRPTRSPRRRATEMQAAVDFGLASPLPGRRDGPRVRLRLRRRSIHGTRASLHRRDRARRSSSRWSATTPSSTSGRTWPPPRTSRSWRRSARTACA